MKQTQGTPTQGMWGATLGFFIGFAAVALFGPTAVKFKEVMNLTPAMIALLVAMPSLSGSLLRIPFSAWVDTRGGRRPFLVLLALSIVGMAGLAYIVNVYYPDNLSAGFYPLLLVLGALSGCGIATFSVGIGQVSYWFDKKHQGGALGTYAGVGNLAPGLFSFLLPFVLAAMGIGGAYVIWLAFLSLGTLVYYFVAKDAWYFQLFNSGMSAKSARKEATKHGQTFFPTGNTVTSLKQSAQVWQTWVLVAIYFTTFGGFIALTAWLPTYWTSYFNVSLVVAGSLTALYSVGASLLRVVGGKVSDHMGGMKTTKISLSIMIIGALLLTISSNMWVAVFAELLLALGMGFGNAAVFKLVPQFIPNAIGGAAGWIGGLGAFGGFVIPSIMAWFIHLGDIGYARGFSVFVVLGIISLLLTRRLVIDEDSTLS